MGGYAALYHAFTRPDLFGVVGAHSPSLQVDDGRVTFLGRGDDFNQRDPVYLATHARSLRNLQVWVDIGKDDDVWMARTTALHDALTARGLAHQLQILPGGHDYNYWTGHILEYIRFYGHALATK
jgi:enterochelin esterase-like enzyme